MCVGAFVCKLYRWMGVGEREQWVCKRCREMQCGIFVHGENKTKCVFGWCECVWVWVYVGVCVCTYVPESSYCVLFYKEVCT